MGKNHLKRLAAPKIWSINRKETEFITKQSPGPHSLELGIPINTILKDILKYASTTREVKKILGANNIKIDGQPRKHFRFPVGLFDVIEFPSINEFYRVIINSQGKLDLAKINKNETSIKPCKIIGKTMVNGKLQLNLYDGKNILVDKNNYKVGDTLLLLLPEQKISKHLKLDKESAIFLIGGRHIGEVGNVEDIVGDKIIYKNKNGSLIETSKNYAFVIGENKPLITLEK